MLEALTILEALDQSDQKDKIKRNDYYRTLLQCSDRMSEIKLQADGLRLKLKNRADAKEAKIYSNSSIYSYREIVIS
jgi:hypothetical protein